MSDRFSQVTTVLWKKIALVLLGLFLSLVLLEVGMRLGGFVLSSIQEYGNSQAIKQKGAYRILCLGESTTSKQYPHFLEEALNQRNIGVHFSVIDKGRPRTNTFAISSRVESYLAEYHPDMVVTMMGINDQGGHMPPEALTPSGRTPFPRSLRTYNLAQFLWLRILTKMKEMGFYKPGEDRRGSTKVPAHLPRNGVNENFNTPILKEDPFKKALELSLKNDHDDVGLGRFYQEHGQFTKAEDSFKKAIEINPKDDDAYAYLGRFYRTQGEYRQAEECLRKAIELNPKNDNAYAGLGWLYRPQGEYRQAEECLRKAIELNPNSDEAYIGLGRLYQVQGEYSKAEDSFKKAIEHNPKNDEAYAVLGENFLHQKKISQAEDLFKRAIELNTRNPFAFLNLEGIYRDQGKLSQAEDLLKKYLEIDPRRGRILRAMASLYEAMGKPELAKAYAEKAAGLRSENYPAVTVSNYRKLKEILDRRGIKLVCVQYPMRDVEPLKRIFENDKGVIFVDNESPFKEAVKKASYKEYFRDAFAGDFGHCTQKGNMLLAQNIAEVILREVFNRK